MSPHRRPEAPLLVVEDSDEDFLAIRRILKKAGLQVEIHRCTSGDDALAYLYHQGDHADRSDFPRPDPALILLDLNLPGDKNGRDVLHLIKHDNGLQSIPVVIFSTSSNPDDVLTCYRHGANGYQVKSLNYEQFKETLLLFARYWLDAALLPARARA